MALGEGSIDAVSFMTLRLASGSVMLLAITAFSQAKRGVPGQRQTQPQWVAALMLFLYAVTFSLAYLQLTAGTGALILFGTVQVTMLLTALTQGEKPHFLEWVGLMLALVGLIYLVLPGLSAPPIGGSILMVLAGIAWGFYSLLGRGSTNPLAYTTANFVRTVPFAMGVSLVSLENLHLTLNGMILALLSGSLASGVGYALWYMALKGLTATRAATIQLAVPVIAAVGGILLLQESFSMRLVVGASQFCKNATLLILHSSRHNEPAKFAGRSHTSIVPPFSSVAGQFA